MHEYESVSPALLLLPYAPGSDKLRHVLQGCGTPRQAAGSSKHESTELELGDRVVCVSAKGTPPFGLRGTIISESLIDRSWGFGH